MVRGVVVKAPARSLIYHLLFLSVNHRVVTLDRARDTAHMRESGVVDILYHPLLLIP